MLSLHCGVLRLFLWNELMDEILFSIADENVQGDEEGVPEEREEKGEIWPRNQQIAAILLILCVCIGTVFSFFFVAIGALFFDNRPPCPAGTLCRHVYY